MPDTFTPNLNLDQPAVGADTDTWGTIMNANLADIDTVFNGDASGTSVGINVGTGKVAKIGGTLKSIAAAIIQFLASTFSLLDDTDNTKVLKFNLAGITTGSTRTLTVPDVSDTIATLTQQAAAIIARTPTGTIHQGYYGDTAPAGFVLARGLTIGPTSSTATERANNDTQNLYTQLWNQGFTPVGGRGANAAADWAAVKLMALPDLRGAVLVNRDNQGGTARNLFTAGNSYTALYGAITATGTLSGSTTGSLSVSVSGSGSFVSGANNGNAVGVAGGTQYVVTLDGHTHNVNVSINSSGNTSGSLSLSGTTTVSTIQPSAVVDAIIAL